MPPAKVSRRISGTVLLDVVHGRSSDHNSHQNGYRITGKEVDIRHCLTRECKDESAMSSVLVGAKFNDSQISCVSNIVSKSLQYYGISLSDKGISALALHIMQESQGHTDSRVHCRLAVIPPY